MRCEIKSKTSSFHWQHSCLLSQSCMTLPEISNSQEKECLIAMRKLYDGTWRKRAWIFQEILLSRKYIISLRNSDFIDLGDVGIIANFLFQRHPGETWLCTFADWCRRLWYLRHFYAQSDFHHLSEANILQMATGLDATVPADKVYALCGILKLKDVPYNNNHSTNEAFQIIIGELVKKGRLSWLYAIPPSLEDHGFQLVQGNTTPFVLTRLSDKLVQNRNKMHMDNTSIGFPVMCIGSIVRTKKLIDFLEETRHWMRVEAPPELPQDLEYLYFAPKIIRRIALDVINPLLIDPLFGQLCHGLGINKDSTSRPTRAWKMILKLYTKDLSVDFPAVESERSPEDRSAASLVWSAARSIRERLKPLQHEFSVVWWQRDGPGKSHEPETISLGSRSCTVGSYICAMKDDEQFYVAASFALPAQSTDATPGENCVVDAKFQGGIYDLGTVRTFQWKVNILFVPIRVSPIDMLEPVFGDHPVWDSVKDTRFDKYMKTDALETRTLSSLFGKVWNQAGRPLYLKITYSAGGSAVPAET
ncbi:hypothetical protein L207DRAFT_181733 [Hyaloscypha variabilis F]|uniref:Heterokaryon incompatibility domain-containing protein n=1 Tax=Hyaloscypha variabilis (strain UAMH 11265 / GT02V1 / F) TaxID=1149755 RepID=A0A2J6R1S9_HYAVF|nr:hypothetical protein L207DRAFT_181733 [Hyaloscypha variabilis F]